MTTSTKSDGVITRVIIVEFRDGAATEDIAEFKACLQELPELLGICCTPWKST